MHPDFRIGCRCHLPSGDRGDQIVTIQQALSSKGYAVAADGDYGVSTQAAVRKFQEDQGLDSDGIVGAATYAALTGSSMPENDSVASAFVTKATADNEILLIQQALVNAGYSVDVDGVFGAGTEQASVLIKGSWLDTDGIVGPSTFYALTGQQLPTGPIRRFGNGGYNGVPRVQNSEATHILDIANQYIGVPYVFGGSTRRASTAPALRATSIRQPASIYPGQPTNSMTSVNRSPWPI